MVHAARAQMTAKRKPATSLENLQTTGHVPAGVISPALQRVVAQFGMTVTPAMTDLIDTHDAADPIAAQFIPSVKELDIKPEELADPIGDETHSPVPGIVHRYPDRLLLKLTHTCASYCRFCFRREQVGKADKPLSGVELDNALGYIAAHSEIWEVILTGGDPLVLSDRRLAEVVERLNSIPHVKIIRIHTRVPVLTPERITPELIAALKGRCPVYVLLHANHPRELTPEARAACGRMVDAGIPMLSQSVLLRGVNDSVEVLTELMRAFVENRIKPHVLNHGDLARGTSHFRLPLDEAQGLLKKLRGNVSGLCQPSYILDIPGGHGKVPVGPVFIEPRDSKINAHWLVEDYTGQRHTYQDVLTADSLSRPPDDEI